ncbi:hypothetical protein M514_15134 [Trichuris suis]|uniref:Uncharacterized protein n=1 Tax=Trichuris suis TaxID=68888 RepID=A0A085NTD4_9BILA|nr:hypothetical protein M514_15134 [Trichuris suis]
MCRFDKQSERFSANCQSAKTQSKPFKNMELKILNACLIITKRTTVRQKAEGTSERNVSHQVKVSLNLCIICRVILYLSW